MRGFKQRIVLAALSFVALVLILGACPKPPPPVVGPADADASLDAGRPATCQAACRHAEAVCPKVDDSTCQDNCGKTAGMAAKLARAAGCPDVKAAGGGNIDPPATPGPARGH